MSEVAAISADGRYVVLLSNADNLLAGVTDTNAGRDVFFHDRIAGTTVLVSHAAGDPVTAGDGEAASAAISADGRWVAFASSAANLVAGQVEGTVSPDVFLWDRDSGLTALVSHLPGMPTTAAGSCWYTPTISADGSRIAFNSSAPDLVPGQSDTGGSLDIFLYDRAADSNTLVSHTSGSATTAAGGALQPALSADGNWVAFASDAAGIAAGQIDANGAADVFLYSRATGVNVLVSHAAGAATTAANDSSSLYSPPQISADGSRIAYESSATDLMTGQTDGNFSSDIFLYDRAAGTNALVSHALSSATTAGNSDCQGPSLSADGRYVAYTGESTDLVAQSTGGWLAVFVYDRVAGTNALVSRGATTPGGDSILPRISSDGAWIGFLSDAANLVAGQTDTPFTWDVFLWSRTSGSLTLVTRTPGSATTAAGSDAVTDLRINADGSWIALTSRSQGLVNGVDDHNAANDVFLFARSTGVITLITSRGGAAGVSAGGSTSYWTGRAMSNDGRFIAFTSAASNLPGITDGNNELDVFLADRTSGAITLVSHASGSPSTTSGLGFREPLVSADGSAVVFESAPVSPFENSQLYLFDPATGGITLISHAAGLPSTPANSGFFLSGHESISGDGRWIAFTHYGTDLVAGQMDGNGAGDVFLFDRTTGASTLVSHASSSPSDTGDGGSFAPAISGDGRYVAFVSNASDLVPGQAGAGGVFLYDRAAGTTTRLSSSGSSPLGISTDGRWVVFTSSAADVVPGQIDTNSSSDVFLWDRVSGSTLLVSHTPGAPATSGNAASGLGTLTVTPNPSVLSADGRFVAFSSDATDLIAGQTGNQSAIFLFDRVTGTVTLVSRSAGSPTATGNGYSGEPAISADGHFVAYLSSAGDLVPGQITAGAGTAGSDFFLYDRTAGTTALVSHIPTSAVTSGKLGAFGGAPRISADGAWVAFSSAAPDLVAGDHDGVTDAFLYANPLAGRDLFTVSPCRIVDTRVAGQGPALTSGLRRTIPAHGLCGIPATARAVAANVTVTQPSAAGYLIFHAGDVAPTATSIINFVAGQTRANNAILPLAFDGSGLLGVTPFVGGNGTVHLVLDVSGYFE
jgi:Tol biopolymer transport system component